MPGAWRSSVRVAHVTPLFIQIGSRGPVRALDRSGSRVDQAADRGVRGRGEGTCEHLCYRRLWGNATDHVVHTRL